MYNKGTAGAVGLSLESRGVSGKPRVPIACLSVPLHAIQRKLIRRQGRPGGNRAAQSNIPGWTRQHLLIVRSE
jgi:hypothetical protein